MGCSGLLRLDKIDYYDYAFRPGSLPVPKTIRVTWREGSFKSGKPDGWDGGTILGGYTVPVAERIPDAVLDYIRNHNASLRLKIRIKDDGVLVGWDVEEWFTLQGSRRLRNVLAGGDFLEAKIFNGKVIDPGWQK